MAFSGFPDDAFRFYEALRADGSKAFWQANRDRYAHAVRRPMEELLAELDDHGPFHVFRPYRDVRFAKGGSPYKDHIGAFAESEPGAGWYVQLSADGMVAGSGYYHMAPDQLARFRAAVDADGTGAEVAALVSGAEAAGLEIGAVDELKTAPRGFAKDHPRIALLRRKGLVTTRRWARAPWMSTAAVVDEVRAVWRAGAAVCAWLDAHVGPSVLPPEEAHRFR